MHYENDKHDLFHQKKKIVTDAYYTRKSNYFDLIFYYKQTRISQLLLLLLVATATIHISENLVGFPVIIVAITEQPKIDVVAITEEQTILRLVSLSK